MEIVLIRSYTEKPWRSSETYDLIEKSLYQKWSVSSILTSDTEELNHFLLKQMQSHGKNLFVFNIAEYLDESTKCGFIPALLDDLKIPHLGSSSQTISLAMDKAKTKSLLANQGIPTPQFFIAGKSENDYSSQAEKIGYPLFVKPLNEGGHIGISTQSIVNDGVQLHTEIRSIIQKYDEPALVEKFIGDANMREFSVGIICGKPAIFTPVEIDYDAMPGETRILSFESAEKDLERIKLVDNKAIADKLIKLTDETFKAVGADDYSRVDIRMDASGYYVLEINVMPGLGPHSFLPEAAESIHKIGYAQLIQRLIESSMRRQHLINQL